jgi:hypothetical protein
MNGTEASSKDASATGPAFGFAVAIPAGRSLPRRPNIVFTPCRRPPVPLLWTRNFGPWTFPPIPLRLSVIGYRLSVIGNRLLAIGYRLSAIGYRLSAIGYRLLSIGYCLLAIGYWLSSIGYRLFSPAPLNPCPRRTP